MHVSLDVPGLPQSAQLVICSEEDEGVYWLVKLEEYKPVRFGSQITEPYDDGCDFVPVDLGTDSICMDADDVIACIRQHAPGLLSHGGEDLLREAMARLWDCHVAITKICQEMRNTDDTPVRRFDDHQPDYDPDAQRETDTIELDDSPL